MSNKVDPRNQVGELSSLSVSERRSRVDELGDLLSSESLFVQSRAMDAVVELSEQYPLSVTELVDTLVGKLGDDTLGEDAALVIGNIAAEDPEVVGDRLPVLIALIDSGGAVTVNVTYAIASLAEASPDALTQEGILAKLFSLIDHDSPAVRINVTGILSQIAAVKPEVITDSFDLVRARLHDDSPAVQRNVVQTMGRLGDSSPVTVFEALDDLCSLLESDDPGVRARVAYALGSVTRAAETIETSDLTELANWLDAEEPLVRQQASYLFAEISSDNPDVVTDFSQQITRRFADADPAVRRNAIRAVSNVEDVSPDDAATAKTVLGSALKNAGASGNESPFTPGELRGLATESYAPPDLRRKAREALVRVGSDDAATAS